MEHKAPFHHKCMCRWRCEYIKQGYLAPKTLGISREDRKKPVPHLEGEVDHQAEGAEDSKNLEKLERIPSSHFGLEKRLLALGQDLGGARREPAGGDVLLHEGILFVPPLPKPDVELLQVAQRDIIETESAPVKVDGFWWLSSDVRASKSEDDFAKFAPAVKRRQWAATHGRRDETYATPSYATVQS